MKLLFQSFELPNLLKDSNNIAGGAAVEWYSWIDGLRKTNQTFALLSYKGTRKYINKELDFEVLESFDLDKGIPKLRFFYYRFPRFYKIIKKYKPDVIITENASAYVGMLALIGKLLKIPFVLRIANDTDVDQRLKSTIDKFDYYLYKFGRSITEYFVAQNCYQKNKLLKKYPNRKVIVIHNPFLVETELKDVVNKQRSYIVWVGNFRYQKNMHELYNVAKSLPNQKFKILGKAHINLDNETKLAVEELQQLRNVEFVGYIKRTEIIDFFSEAILLLNTSRWEGFTNTFLEAWSAGTPIVTTKYVNPDEIISRNNLGFVADNYSELPKCVMDIVNHQEYLNFNKRCFEYVKHNHDPVILSKKLVSFLSNMS